jgi:thiamine biosynthesis lipoprotein
MLKFLIVFLLPLVASAAISPPEKGEICETEQIMTLPWTICLIDAKKGPEELHAAIKESMNELRNIDGWMSEWKPKSIISQINDNAGIKPVHVTPDAMDAITKSLDEGRRSDGAFDITFNAFFGKYDWKKGEERFPTPQEIKDILPLVNYRNVDVDLAKQTVFLKKKRMKIGLGGMGEGWAIDHIFELLKPKKIQAGYIDASGGVRVWGKKTSGKLWTIGIGDPRPMNRDESRKRSLFDLYATDIAVTTAGDTEKYFEKDGKRYHHIIDPKTGQSADQSIQVTAICKTATICDLVDDSIYIMGAARGQAYAEKIGVGAVIINPARVIFMTTGLRPIDTKWGRQLEMTPKLKLLQ